MRATLVAVLLVVACAASQAGALGDDKLKDLMRSMGRIELKIVEAQVPDYDPLPGQKDSDVFVRVYLNDTKELLCETQVVQDENKPKFDKECRTSKPVSANTELRFEIYDSDKPTPDPDWIGMTRVRISDLILNRKLDSKEPYKIQGHDFPKYFIKAKIDFKPEK